MLRYRSSHLVRSRAAEGWLSGSASSTLAAERGRCDSCHCTPGRPVVKCQEAICDHIGGSAMPPSGSTKQRRWRTCARLAQAEPPDGEGAAAPRRAQTRGRGPASGHAGAPLRPPRPVVQPERAWRTCASAAAWCCQKGASLIRQCGHKLPLDISPQVFLGCNGRSRTCPSPQQESNLLNQITIPQRPVNGQGARNGSGARSATVPRT